MLKRPEFREETPRKGSGIKGDTAPHKYVIAAQNNQADSEKNTEKAQLASG